MKILITGTPGTGKTTISKRLSKEYDIPRISVNSIIDEHPGVVEEVNEEGEKVIKPDLKNVLEEELGGDYVIDTHLIEFTPEADVVVITRTNPVVLKQRLEDRGYSKEKVRENLETEVIDYFTQAVENEKVIEVDTSSKTVDETITEIKKGIEEKEWNKGSVSWSEKEHVETLT